MAKKKDSCCGTGEDCRIDSIVTVDDRGQMVLPKELRERAGIGAGDKLALATWEKGGKVRCITLMKAEELVGMLKERLGPVMKDLL